MKKVVEDCSDAELTQELERRRKDAISRAAKEKADANFALRKKIETARKTALKDIEKNLAAATALIEEAQRIADEAQVEFGFSLRYGMGGTYSPKRIRGPDGKVVVDDLYDGDREGWVSSSDNC